MTWILRRYSSPQGRYAAALVIISLVSMGLYSYGALRNHSLAASYLVWNLFLAWLPLLLAIRLMKVLSRKAWSSWEGLITSFLWLAFLPNSFYLISDFIHLQEVEPANVLYDSVMFTSFVVAGIALGFTSLYLVHNRLLDYMKERRAAVWISVMLLFCSVAIYMGRDLRWNTWDIFVNPAGLLFETADRVQHPASYPHMLLVVAAFFVLLAGMYNLAWQGVRLLRRMPRL